MMDVDLVVEKLRKGGVVAIMTEIGIELVCDATNGNAVALLKKKLTSAEPLFTIFVLNINQLSKYVLEIPEFVEQLFEYSTKPISLRLPNVQNLSAEAVLEKGKASFRISNAHSVNSILRKFRAPLFAIPLTRNGAEVVADRESMISQLSEFDFGDYVSEEGMPTTKLPSLMDLGVNGEILIIRE